MSNLDVEDCSGYILPFAKQLRVFVYFELPENEESWKLEEFKIVTNGDYHYVCSAIILHGGEQEVTHQCQWLQKM